MYKNKNDKEISIMKVFELSEVECRGSLVIFNTQDIWKLEHIDLTNLSKQKYMPHLQYWSLYIDDYDSNLDEEEFESALNLISNKKGSIDVRIENDSYHKIVNDESLKECFCRMRFKKISLVDLLISDEDEFCSFIHSLKRNGMLRELNYNFLRKSYYAPDVSDLFRKYKSCTIGKRYGKIVIK